MKKRSKPVFTGSENIAALVYLCAISTVTMYLLCRDHIVICTIAMTALCSGIYMLFYALRNRRLISFLAFMLLFGGVMLTVSSVGAAYGQIALMEFIYTTSDFFNTAMAAAVIVLFSFVVTYPVYYFTVRLPRPCFLLLPALAPLILSARTIGTLPGWLMAFMAASYFVVVMGVSRAEYPSENRYFDDKKARKERLAAIGIFGAAAMAVLMIVPRNAKTPYANYLDATRFTSASIYATQTLSSFSQSSTPNTGNNQPSEDTLFYVMTDTPRNVISQSFDRYYGREGWTYIRDISSGYANWQDEQRRLNYNKLAADLKRGAAEGKLGKFADDILALPDLSVGSLQSTAMTIQVVDTSNTSVIRHPSGTFSAYISGNDATIYRNSKDEMFTRTPFGEKAMYTLQYYGAQTNSDFARYLSGLEETDFFDLLELAVNDEVIESETASAFRAAYLDASAYGVRTYDSTITPKIQALADTITAGLDNDYDKALAIEQWFGEGGFSYDLNFVPQELSAEYFLFTSKRGICTDFATASTLLLRAAGIPARYTEGFLIKTDVGSVDIYGRYVVKADQGHAFSTAYIPGGGWVEIDGTKYAAVVSRNAQAQRVVFYAAIAAGIVAVICFIFRKRLSEAAFVVRYKLGRGKKKIRALYLRTRALACSISGADPKITTSGEVCDVISRTLSLGSEAGEITAAADALIYGGAAGGVDEKRLYRNYRLIRKAQRKRR
ncbi:MAG: transglutaminase-like domain-containing protein [Oscillospiraceae bacterium]|nr:transglutaminase-like domain-containing protein [Oscillospiraceae bacterium]